jgi:tetratricopeptide (TPR) repeat protein
LSLAIIAVFAIAGPTIRAIADDAHTCLNGTDEEKTAACTRVLESGRFDEDIRLNPGSADAYRHRGMAYRAKGDLDRAIADHTEAIRLQPDFAKAYNSRGFAYATKGDLDRAVITQRRSDSIATTWRRTTTAATFISRKAISSALSPTIRRRSASIRSPKMAM